MRAFFAVAVLAALLTSCTAERQFRATDITGANFARELSLIGHDGKPRTLDDFRGKVIVLFFGFAHCPDVCPSTLAQYAQAAKQLGADADRVQFAMITVDPERDTPELLARYVTAFDARFLGLYGDAEATARTAKEFKVLYRKQPGKTEDTYSVDHSGGTYVFDRDGRVRLFARHDQAVEDLVADVRLLLAG